jgi:hypothetical protein
MKPPLISRDYKEKFYDGEGCGTCIRNFHKKLLPSYIEAIILSGDDQLSISLQPAKHYEYLDCYSFHDHNENRVSLDFFYEILRKVEQSKKTIAKPSTPFKVGDKILLQNTDSKEYLDITIRHIGDGGKAVAQYCWYNLEKNYRFVEVIE